MAEWYRDFRSPALVGCRAWWRNFIVFAPCHHYLLSSQDIQSFPLAVLPVASGYENFTRMVENISIV